MRRALILLVLLPAASQAREPGLAVAGLGGADIFGSGTRSGLDVRLEYRAGLSLLPATAPLFTVRPWAGLEGTSRGSMWGGAGLLLDIPVGAFSVVPMAGLGGYHQGRGKDLGTALEFRTGAELAYRLRDGSRVGVAFTHTSNAGIGGRNPGLESVVVNYELPLALGVGR